MSFHSQLARYASFLTVAGLAAASFAACSDDRDAFPDGGGTLPTPDASDLPDTSSCGYRCSPDLKRVLKGCEGSEVEDKVCAPDKGCGVDSCIDACEAAALSKGSIGCSFWTLPPDDGDDGAGACFAAMIANTWDHPVNISADWGADPLDITQSVYTSEIVDDHPKYTLLEGPLPPGQVAIVFLARAAVVTDEDAVECPVGVVPAVRMDPIRHGTTKTKAFHLKTDMPVSAYSSFPYGGAESFYPAATLLLPVTSWDKNYIAVSTGKYGDPRVLAVEKRTIQIVANEDDTRVSIRPNTTISEGNDVAPANAGEAQTWTLSRGQVLQITQNNTTTGSPIESNKPVGLFGGAPCNFLPAEVDPCDLTQQMIPPFSQWGSEYAAVPFPSRIDSITGSARELVPYMFVGAADGTELTYEPSRPAGAPYTLSAGQAVYFMTDDIFTVKSQDAKHPFYAALHMTSSTFNGGLPGSGPGPGGGRVKGDPDFVNIAPSDQFLDRYVFFADYTYPETMLTIVRRKTATGFKPVELACGGAIPDFRPLDSKGQYEYAWVHLTKGGAPQKFERGECGYGHHEARSDGPFSVTVWGIGKDASYGYVGGVGSRPINQARPPIVN